MKKWLLFAAAAAVAALVAKKLLPAQNRNDADITDVIYDESTTAPVQAVEPLAATPPPQAAEITAEEKPTGSENI